MFKKMVGGLSVGAAAFGRALPTIARDVAGLGAVGLISYGAWMVTPAAGFITAGTLVLAGVIAISRAG